MSRTAIENTAVLPFIGSLSQYDLDYIIFMHRQFARNDKFSRLQGGAPSSSEYLQPDQVGAFQRTMISQGASQFKKTHPASTDAEALAYGLVYFNCTMAVRRIYVDSYLDADTALVQLDAMLAAGG